MRKVKDDQRGIAAIIVVAILISVITLIVLGFASVVRRQQRQALDQQLSAQARLAAESAINEVIARFRADPASIVNQPNCEPVRQSFQASGTEEIQTTCVRINNAPGPLEFDEVTPDNSTIIWLDPGSEVVDRLVITWQKSRAEEGDCLVSDYTVFPPTISANQMGVVRFDLSRVGPAGAPFTRETLRISQLGGVLYPKENNNIPNFNWVPPLVWSGNPEQPVVFGACDNDPATPAGAPDAYKAYAIIDVPDNSDRYILRLRGLYDSSAIKVMGFTPEPDNEVIAFQGSQISIEATARVRDVVQRIQVRVPATTPPRNLLPNEAIHVGGAGFCKLLEAEPASVPADGC